MPIGIRIGLIILSILISIIFFATKAAQNSERDERIKDLEDEVKAKNKKNDK